MKKLGIMGIVTILLTSSGCLRNRVETEPPLSQPSGRLEEQRESSNIRPVSASNPVPSDRKR